MSFPWGRLLPKKDTHPGVDPQTADQVFDNPKVPLGEIMNLLSGLAEHGLLTESWVIPIPHSPNNQATRKSYRSPGDESLSIDIIISLHQVNPTLHELVPLLLLLLKYSETKSRLSVSPVGGHFLPQILPLLQ